MSDRVAIIGPGRVGTTLAAALTRAGRRLAACGGGSAASRDRFSARFAGVRTYEVPADAVRAAGLVVFAVPDDVLESVVTAVAVADAFVPGQRVVHVAGALGLQPLRRAAAAGARVAACHPAQTVPTADADPDALVGAAWAVTAAPGDLGWASELVTAVGGDPFEVPDEARVLYHAGLVVGSNAVGAVVSVARQLLLAAGLEDPTPFLQPLVAASAANVIGRGAEALTGPVVRGDVGTLQRHLARLDADVPELAAAYRALGHVVLGQVRPALDPGTILALESALRGPS